MKIHVLLENDLQSLLCCIVTSYDMKQANKRGYNPYALVQYLDAAKQCAEYCETHENTSTRDNLSRYFNDRLLSYILKELCF